MTIIDKQGTALITGASSGIGAIYADRLAHRGHDLILVARNKERLMAVADKIRASTGKTVEIVVADLGSVDGRSKVEAVLRENASIDILVNNAGFGGVTPLLESDIDQMEAMIEVNVTGMTRLSYAAIPGFVARGRGTVINIASVVSIAPEMLNGVYGASKAYVLAFTQSLQHELASKGIRAQAVLPGATATEFWDIAGFPHSNMPPNWIMRSEDLVDAALRGLDLGEVVTIPPLQDGSEWDAYEAMRRGFAQRFQYSTPGTRYIV